MKWVRPTLFVVIAVILLGSAAAFRYYAQRRLNAQLLVDAKTALDGNEFAEAEHLARRVISAGETTEEARLIAGEAAMKLGSDDRALVYLEPLLDGADERSLIALNASIDMVWDKGDATQAERLLRRVLELDSDDPVAMARLAYLLTLTGRHWESLPLRLELVRKDQFQVDDLLLLGNSRALIQSDELNQLRLASPDDPLLMLGEASIAARQNDVGKAQQLLRRILAARDDLVAAHALFGSLLIERPGLAPREVEQWNAKLPAGADDHPDIWVVRGLWTMRGKPEEAARCFWEAVRRNPNHQLANYQLALALRKFEEPRATWFSERADALEELERMLGVLDTDRNNIASMKRTIELTEKLGRYWEVWGWSRAVLLVDNTQKWAQEARDRASEQFAEGLAQVAPQSDPAKLYDFSTLTLPEWLTAKQ